MMVIRVCIRCMYVYVEPVTFECLPAQLKYLFHQRLDEQPITSPSLSHPNWNADIHHLSISYRTPSQHASFV